MSEDQIVTGSQSGSIRVWDMEAAKSKREGRGGGQRCQRICQYFNTSYKCSLSHLKLTAVTVCEMQAVVINVVIVAVMKDRREMMSW